MKPIIDVHSHIFNAGDIPLKGYLMSRKFGEITDYIAKPIIPVIAKCLRDQLDPNITKGFYGGISCVVALNIAYKIMGKQYKKWALSLSKEVIEIAEELVETFEMDKIDLYVPLVIDYEYWFKNTKDIQIDKQIDHIYNNIIIPYQGKIHPFVPFDPAREIVFRKNMKNPDRKPERHGSFKLVKDAIENKGFIGVKLYNAMGYKPFNNHLVDKNRQKISLHKKRYVFKGEEYDEVLSELYDYCIKEEIPITTHCGMEGTESYPDASFDFGQAKFWKEVLDQDRFKNLRLNLAHFGWNKKEAFDHERSWVKIIAEMLGKYKNLYTDVSHHEVVKPENNSYFKSTYSTLTSNYPSLSKKLLFGIDWHVIKRLPDYSKFKERYLEILRHNNMFNENEIEDFLGGNAIKFLGLLPGNKNRKRLERFYKKEDILPPSWFTSIASL